MPTLIARSTAPAPIAGTGQLYNSPLANEPRLRLLSPEGREAILAWTTAGKKRVLLRPVLPSGASFGARSGWEWSTTPINPAAGDVIIGTPGAAAWIDRQLRWRLTGADALSSAGFFPTRAVPSEHGSMTRRRGFILHGIASNRTCATVGAASLFGVYEIPPLVVQNAPDTPNNFIIGFGQADAVGDGWLLYHRTGTDAVDRVAIGASIAPRSNTFGFRFWMHAPPVVSGEGYVAVVLQNLDTLDVFEDVRTSNLPDPDTLLVPEFVASPRASGVVQIQDCLLHGFVPALAA